MVEGEARDYRPDDQGDADHGLQPSHDPALLPPRHPARDERRERRDGEPDSDSQHTHDRVEERAVWDDRYQRQTGCHDGKSADEEPLFSEAWLQSSDEHSLREHGAGADESEEE